MHAPATTTVVLHLISGHRAKNVSFDYLLFVQQWPPGFCTVSLAIYARLFNYFVTSLAS